MIRTAGGVEYELTYKRVKNLNLRVGEDGSVRVSAARRVPLRQIDAFVQAHAGWIKRACPAAHAADAFIRRLHG